MKKLTLEFKNETLRCLLLRGREIERFEQISTREVSADALRNKLQVFTKEKRKKVVLVLPRNLIIERRFDFETSENGDETNIFFEKLKQSLPVSLDEMSYGFNIQTGEKGVRGVLLATPLDPLRNILKNLSDAGILPDEVVSSDQGLLGLVREREKGTFLLLCAGEVESELLVISCGKLTAYRSFQRDDPQMEEELNYFLLEVGVKPEAILLCGLQDAVLEKQISHIFSVSAERLSLPQNAPPALYGAACLDGNSLISLLPKEMKVEKLKKERKSLFTDMTMIFVLLSMTVCLGLYTHKRFETERLQMITKRIAKLNPEFLKIEKTIAILQTFSLRTSENLVLLNLIKTISQDIPGEVILNEFDWNETGLRLRGTSASYSGVVGTTQALAKSDSLESAHLEYARLRKKVSHDFFEFEVSAIRKKESLKEKLNLSREQSTASGIPLREALRLKEEQCSKIEFFLGHKNSYFDQYESLKKESPSLSSSSDAVNDWMKEIMAKLESNGLKVGQLQPTGTEERSALKSVQIKIQFDGELKNFVAFLYPFASYVNGVLIESLAVSKDKSSKKTLSYEAIFSKLLL
ncbi:MAG: hypothetical protein A2036_04305 [Omnitrophica bacterium GWA2_50_21]|nr:MAG: hypothetical protein A2036_04305 [Omnitrophica bacterium GWA2_50_21]